MAKTGDIVRFLNTTGGGRITRIEGRVAYVDDDGFETPVLLNEVVVVTPAEATIARIDDTMAKASASQSGPSRSSGPGAAYAVQAEELPVEETSYGDKINVVLAYEPRDIKALQTTSFDAFVVNDSNYYLSLCYLTSADGNEWTVVTQTVVEPNTQLLVDEVERERLSEMQHVALQWTAFKRDKPFALKMPLLMERKLDLTKFFKLHCFKDNTYFDTKVLVLEVMVNDAVPTQGPDTATVEELSREFNRKVKERPTRRPVKRRAKNNVRDNNGVLEVDLHISELLDNTAGMEPAEILNYQIDTFRKVMDENLQSHGRKIVFIHGKGEGVLRNALMKELNHRYKGHQVQDASFREYGYGATQITIK